MPNLSFQCWTGALRCDAERHDHSHKQHLHYPDWYYDAAKTAAEYKSKAREDGWKFKRGGSVICPDCAKLQ